MNRAMKIAMASGVALALGLAAATAGAGPYGYGPGWGPMGGYGPGYGMGPRMMGGYGPGWRPTGGYGPGYGMGPGMMGGYGPGMMAGYGPGMYRGYGPEQNSAPPDLNSPAGRLFAQTCSQCHALPDPRQHSAEQWPSVVARMQQHMQQRDIALPGRQAIDKIDAFLEQHTNE